MNLVEQVTEQVRTEIEQGILKAKADGRFDFAEMPAFIVEVPKDKSHGDFATNAAMLLTKQAKMKPRDIAQAIVDSLNKESKLIEKVEIAGPGFINFYLSQNWLYDILPVVEAQDTAYGSVDIGKGEKVQVEFVSANPTGLLHMGNARGGALGDSLANLLKMAGYDVTKEFYINDAGNQIVNLGLSLEARYRQLLGETGCEIPENGYHGQDIIDTAQRIVDAVGDSYLQLPEAERQEKMIATALDEKIAAIKSG
ncbi:MAG: arginine--tRNA ligase, partial [Peptococcaceae bacterium]|nr:arginine--tRNA ligase [Peptococcaceae bacterium]